MDRSNRTAKKRDAFLLALEDSANVSKACKKAKLPRRTAYEWRDDDKEFRAEWDAALDRATDALEDEAIRRATEGTLKPVFYKGTKCGTIREYSDTLLMFMLKARRPEKFKDRVTTEHIGAGGGPIQQVSMTTDEFRQIAKGIADEV